MKFILESKHVVLNISQFCDCLFQLYYNVQNNTNRALYLIVKCIWKGVGLILVHIQSCYEDNNHPSMSGQYTFMILSKVLKNMYNLW